ncbi:hypothetical protein BKA67DRAFT_582027 [Truncatella angustata]|uniref:Apple domain-containing protein n=1 Tax=Truncatella angustata TaxID=152316 RepID=A0A9P8RJJ4_9PEZI|nr:uncharacterized protein BKA67DRAFT_582027 [Truncatella angustata]KAH6647229.1 hypothetical protein BKA67DRAFT_582027 [Truncatella angustata]KAH8201507.1 hypothetical protein TruAng_004355 [Truncatella angustata]
MFFTTLVSAGLTAFAFTNTATAIAVRSGDVCKGGPYTAYSALSHYPAAQTYCSSAYAASAVTTYVTTTLTTEALATITVTELSTVIPTSSVSPAKAKRGKCRGTPASQSVPVYSANSTAYHIPQSTGYHVAQSSSSAKKADLLSSLISGPSSVAKAACSCLVGTTVTVTATSTALYSSVATAPAQVSGTATVTTVLTVTEAVSTTSESSSSSSSTVSSTSTTSSAAATPTCSSETTQYQTDNDLVWEITSNSLYGATDSNSLSRSEQPDLSSCLEACSVYQDCAYAIFVADESYGAAHQCYFLSSSDAGFGTGYCGVDTARLIAA